MMIRKKGRGMLAALLVLCLLLSACGASGTAAPDDAIDTGADDDWTAVEDGTLRLENDRVLWEMDAATTHFTVTDKATGAVYRSVPADADGGASEETQARMTAELTAVYYDTDSNRLIMTSGRDGVEGGGVTVRQNDGTVRVYYTLGSSTGDLLVPQLFTQTFFEDTLCAAECFSSSQLRRLKRYYALYSPQEPDDGFSAMAERYPALKTQALYILKDTADDMARLEIDEYMQLFGYTQEQYTAVLDELGIEHAAADEAGFVIPVEYALTADGFTARVLMDKVTERSASYTLQQVALLEYFGSIPAETKGQFLVPDGSGAVIETDRSGTYAGRIYGEDAGKGGDGGRALRQQLCLPVFGMSYGDHGLFAVIETAAEAAELAAETVSASCTQSHIYPVFHVREMDTTDIGADRNILSFNLYAKQRLRQSPCVRYALLGGDAVDYGTMAAWYRTYLEQNGTLTPQKDAAGLLLEYWGMVTEDASFLGIPYDKKLTLSTFTGIENDLDTLAAAGIDGVTVRLQGFGTSGLAHAKNSAFSLYRGTGTQQELLALAERLTPARLFLEADPQVVYDDRWFDGFSPKADAARALSRKTALLRMRDPATREEVSGRLSRYALSPARYAETAASFLESLKKAALPDGLGLSYQSAGHLLTGDYGTSHPVDRAAAAQTVQALLQAAGRPVMADGANLYTLSALARIDDLALCSSGADVTAYDVPFLPMVLHGSIPYSGTPVNLSSDPERALLKAAEYGAGLSYVLCTEDETAFSATPYGRYFYSLCSADQLSAVADAYRRVRAADAATAGSRFIRHERLGDTLARSTFDNGAQILVNYGDAPQTVDGVTVPAAGFVTLVDGKITEGEA